MQRVDAKGLINLFVLLKFAFPQMAQIGADLSLCIRVKHSLQSCAINILTTKVTIYYLEFFKKI